MKVKLRQIRTEKKISQAKIAALLGISQPQYCRKEAGEDNFSDTDWATMSEYFGVEEEVIRANHPQMKSKNDNTFYMQASRLSDKLVEVLEERILELKAELAINRDLVVEKDKIIMQLMKQEMMM